MTTPYWIAMLLCTSKIDAAGFLRLFEAVLRPRGQIPFRDVFCNNTLLRRCRPLCKFVPSADYRENTYTCSGALGLYPMLVDARALMS